MWRYACEPIEASQCISLLFSHIKILKLIFIAFSSYSCCNDCLYISLCNHFSHFCLFYVHFRLCPWSSKTYVKCPQITLGQGLYVLMSCSILGHVLRKKYIPMSSVFNEDGMGHFQQRWFDDLVMQKIKCNDYTKKWFFI